MKQTEEALREPETAEAETAAAEAAKSSEENAAAEPQPEGAEAAEAVREAGEEAGIPEEKSAGEEENLIGKKRAEKELEKKDAEIAELNEKYLRLFAEFDNYRKRTEKEKSSMYEVGARDVVEKILPVLDNFERGFALVEKEDEEDPFTEGMRKIYKQFVTILTDMGVTPIEAEGKPFDPDLHNAAMHVEDPEFGENVVAEELLKGYKYKDTVVRYSMVKVAN